MLSFHHLIDGNDKTSQALVSPMMTYPCSIYYLKSEIYKHSGVWRWRPVSQRAVRPTQVIFVPPVFKHNVFSSNSYLSQATKSGCDIRLTEPELLSAVLNNPVS